MSIEAKHFGPLGRLIDMETTRIYENIRIIDVNIKLNRKPFFEQRGKYIKKLSIINSKVDYSIFNFLTSLEHLEISCRDSSSLFNLMSLNVDVPACFKNLKSLRFLNHLSIHGDTFKKITKTIPSLEEFTIKEVNYTIKLDCYNFLYNYRHTLKSLNISKTFCGYLFESTPVIFDDLDLKELRIEIDKKTIECALGFILSQKNLIILDIQVCSLTSRQIMAICDSLSKLELLNYTGYEVPINSIRKLKNLKALHLPWPLVDDSSVCEISTSRNEKLQVLSLSKNVVNKTFLKLFINLPNLRELDIMFDQMNIDLFQLIFEYLINLEMLEIYWINSKETFINNNTEMYDIGRLTKLKSLNIQFPADNIPGFSLDDLMKLKNLTSLSLYQSVPITIDEQIKLMKSLPLLRYVNFKKWKGIDYSTIISIRPSLNKRSKFDNE